MRCPIRAVPSNVEAGRGQFEEERVGVMGGGVVGRVGGAMLNPKKLGVKTQGSIRSHPSHLLRLMLRQYWLHL